MNDDGWRSRYVRDNTVCSKCGSKVTNDVWTTVPNGKDKHLGKVCAKCKAPWPKSGYHGPLPDNIAPSQQGGDNQEGSP